MARQVALRPGRADVAACEEAKVERSQAATATGAALLFMRQMHDGNADLCPQARKQKHRPLPNLMHRFTKTVYSAHLREIATTGRPKSSAAAPISRCSWSNELPGRTQSAGGSLQESSIRAVAH